MGLYFIYVIVTGALVYAFNGYGEIDLEGAEIVNFAGTEISQDRIALVEDRSFAFAGRINLIASAQETLEISYYTIHHGDTSAAIFGAILNSADRGVKVRILLDGATNNFFGSEKQALLSALRSHPGIEIKFYDPPNFFKPWAWNNRLHDKYIIVDNRIAMMGGRNLGDKYLLKDYPGEVIEDRDIVIVNTGTSLSGSVINEIKTYFNYVWNHDYSKSPGGNLRRSQVRRGAEKAKSLQDGLQLSQGRFDIDWLSLSVPTNKISFIHNPIMRYNKEPWVLEHITMLMEQAEDRIVVQSPYVILTKPMRRNFNAKDIQADIIVLTNSTATSPNYLGMAGYLKHRTSIADAAELYEYQGSGSIHGKTYIIDDRWSIVGSFNADPRSSFLSTEVMVIVDSKEFTQVLSAAVDDLLAESLKVGDDTYVENKDVEPRDSPLLKTWLIGFLYIALYGLDFLL